mgnify:CR=1 FL=1
MKVNLDVVGRTYTVHFAEQINAFVTFPCSYCGDQQGHPAELVIQRIEDEGRKMWQPDSLLGAVIGRELRMRVLADKVVCDRAACKKRLRRDMDYWYREAGAEDDTAPSAAE